MMTVLDKYGAEGVRSDVLGDKLKVTFIIKDPEQALTCFRDFNLHPYLN